MSKKCTGCKREFTKEELEQIQSKQKVKLKNTCPDCRKPLKTNDQSRFQKKWYGYLNNDERFLSFSFLTNIMKNLYSSYTRLISKYKKGIKNKEKKWGHRANLAPSYLGTRIAVGGLNF